jgi:hypothetical protein
VVDGTALAPVLLAAGGLAVLALAAGLALGRPESVPVAVALLGAAYVAELAAHDEPLALGAALYAAGLLLTAELAY